MWMVIVKPSEEIVEQPQSNTSTHVIGCNSHGANFALVGLILRNAEAY